MGYIGYGEVINDAFNLLFALLGRKICSDWYISDIIMLKII